MLEHGEHIGRATLGLLGGCGLDPVPRLPAGLQHWGWAGVLFLAPRRLPPCIPQNISRRACVWVLFLVLQLTPSGPKAGTQVTVCSSNLKHSTWEAVGLVPPTRHSPSLQQPGHCEGPTVPIIKSQPYHLEHQIRTGEEHRPKLGSPAWAGGRQGPRQTPATFRMTFRLPACSIRVSTHLAAAGANASQRPSRPMLLITLPAE